MYNKIISSLKFRYCHFLKHYYPYIWVKRLYKAEMGKKVNFSHPKDINEKILWLSFFTDTSLWTTLADKYAVREYVKERIGEEYLVPLLGKWDKAEDIDFSRLPDKFVIKPNNGCYDCCIVKDKNSTDLEAIRQRMRQALLHRFGYESAEMHYTRIKPCIIAEELLESKEKSGLVDYKIWCFNGEPHNILVCSNRDYITHHSNLISYDLNWNKRTANLTHSFQNKAMVEKPENLQVLLNIASKLSQGLPQARIDLYNINGKIYFGEITLTSNYGMMPYYTQSVLDDMGAHCTLPKRSVAERINTFCNRWFPKFKKDGYKLLDNNSSL